MAEIVPDDMPLYGFDTGRRRFFRAFRAAPYFSYGPRRHSLPLIDDARQHLHKGCHIMHAVFSGSTASFSMMLR